MNLEPLNRDTLHRFCGPDLRAIRYFEMLTDAVNGLTGSRSVGAASGAAFGFSSIPEGANEILIALDAVTMSGAANIAVTLGTAAALDAAGYGSTSSYIDGAVVGSVGSATAFVAWCGSAGPISGAIRLTRFAAGEHGWLSEHHVRRSATQTASGASAVKVLTGPLAQIAVAPTGGATFTGGRIAVSYRQ